MILIENETYSEKNINPIIKNEFCNIEKLKKFNLSTLIRQEKNQFKK